jgi:methylmalonyl-CoA/ethylmalonyl-CoA epimerase
MIAGEMFQLGVVVRDLEAAMRHWGTVTGGREFLRIDTDYQAIHRGEEVHVANRNAFVPWGNVMVELVEPGRHEGLQWEWLSTRGEGLFHYGFATDDMTQRYPGKGVVFEPLSGEPPHIVFLDTADELGYYLELFPTDRAAALFERVREAEVR